MAQKAPPFKTTCSAHKAKNFNAGFGATDLQAQGATFPPFGPQETDVHNANAAAHQNAIVTLEDDTTFTVALAPGETYPIRVAIKALQVSGADVSARCYWWTQAGKDDFAYHISPLT